MAFSFEVWNSGEIRFSSSAEIESVETTDDSCMDHPVSD
jgi:hypothetical protein